MRTLVERTLAKLLLSIVDPLSGKSGKYTSQRKPKLKATRTVFILSLALLSFILFPSLGVGAILKVDGAGEFLNIQDAIDAASPGDLVLVSDGIYKGNRNTNLDFMGKAITLRSENGRENCIIDGDGVNRGFYFHSGEGPQTVLSGFTIRNCHAEQYGGGIYCTDLSSPTINDCTITGNTAHDGGGLVCAWSSPTINNCAISGNSSLYAGGIYILGNTAHPTIINCTITGNSATFWGGGILHFGGFPNITKCTISGNTALRGGGVYDIGPTYFAAINNCTVSANSAQEEGGGIYLSRSPARITNCDISNNTSTYLGAGIRSDDSPAEIINCYISGNNGQHGGGIACSGNAPTISESTITGNFATHADGAGIYLTGSNATITNCIIAKNTATYWGGGIRSISSSPAITNCTIMGNRGSTGGGISCSGNYPTITNSVLWANIATNTGPQVYHSDSLSTPVITYSDIQGSYPGEENINQDPMFVSLTDYHLQSTSPCINKGKDSAAPPTDRDGLTRPQGMACDMGAYEYSFHVIVPDHFATIQGAIDYVLPGATVVVKDGVYKGDGNTNLDFKGKAITLRSEKGPADCIIDGEGVNSGLIFQSGEGPQSILSGFTIRNCHTSGYGGGIRCYSSSPTISNCIIAGNSSAYSGGGISSDTSSSPNITNCTITDNTASFGGGIFCYYHSSPTITNCTISRNTALINGGGVYCWDFSSPKIMNSILWGDTVGGNVDEIYRYDQYSSSPNVTYSDVQGGYTGVGNINSDPLFVSVFTANYRLRPYSPCIDRGTESGAPFTDLDGVLRPQGLRYDIGAYEYPKKPDFSFLLLLLDD